jgi:hypothetical protein
VKDGCVFSTKSGYCKIKGRIAAPNELEYFYHSYCKGTLNEKKQCPEWGPTIEAESYYKNKLKLDKQEMNEGSLRK